MSFLSDIQMIKSWKKTKDFLQGAKSYVPFDLLTEHQILILKEFDEYVNHNELGLAFDQLEYLSETIDLPNEFWKEMLLAARQMKMDKATERCKKHLN